MAVITSTLDPNRIPVRPLPRRHIKRYAPPLQAMMRLYDVEIRQGADTTKVIPWWGPLDTQVMFDEMALKHGLLATQCWY